MPAILEHGVGFLHGAKDIPEVALNALVRVAQALEYHSDELVHVLVGRRVVEGERARLVHGERVAQPVRAAVGRLQEHARHLVAEVAHGRHQLRVTDVDLQAVFANCNQSAT